MKIVLKENYVKNQENKLLVNGIFLQMKKEMAVLSKEILSKKQLIHLTLRY